MTSRLLPSLLPLALLAVTPAMGQAVDPVAVKRAA